MATVQPPASTPRSPERVQKSPLQASASPVEVYGHDDLKENSSPRKPLPEITLPPSGRLHGAPMSPVTVNVQPDNWSPKPSSARIEGVKLPIRSQTEAPNSPSRRLGSDSETTVQQVSNKLYYLNHSDGKSRKSETGVISFVDSPTAASSVSDHSNRNSGDPSRDMAQSSLKPLRTTGEIEPVPSFQYHHQSHNSDEIARQRVGNGSPFAPARIESPVNRNLTPTIPYGRRSVIPRPSSAYSDMGGRGRSPANIQGSPTWAGRTASAHSGARSPDNRPLSYVDLLNVPYPQPAPPTSGFDNSALRNAVGGGASLLSTQKTLEMYRLNVKKTNDASIQYAFAVFLISASQEAGLHENAVSSQNGKQDPENSETLKSSPQDLIRESRQILSRLADRSYPFAQYYLADGYASGLFNKGREDYDRAFPLFVAASKHGHAESGYRAALCYEFGWGSRKDPAKAIQFYRQSASKNHPGAMTRLGRACLSGDLGGLSKYREGLTWLKRATESADPQYNAAPYHLGLLYETGYGDDIFLDETYAAQLFTQAADLGHPEANYRLGDAYEHGKLSCPRDPALSVHFYTGAAERGHPAAMMALCAWYMVGAEPVLEKDENEAYEWARRAAELGLTKAEYAVGYFTEMGIGCRRDPLEANVWYVRAADAGDERAKHRIAAIRAAASGADPMNVARAAEQTRPKPKKKGSGNTPADRGPIGSGTGVEGPIAKEEKEKECIVM